MKRRLAFLSLLVIGSWCAAADPVAIPIENGGFENGLNDWTVKNGGGVIVVPEAAHDGQGGLRVPTVGKVSVHAFPVPVDCGKKYRVSGWVRGVSSVPMTLNLAFRNDLRKFLELENPLDFQLNLPAGSEWQHFSKEFVPPDGAVSMLLNLAIWVAPGKGGSSPIDVDEITLEEIGDAN